MFYKYRKIIFSTIVILTGVAFAQGQDDVTVDVLKPVVNRGVMEKQPSRWFEASDQTNTFPFKRAVDGMSYDEQDAFVIGRSFFTIPWVAAPSAVCDLSWCKRFWNDARLTWQCKSCINF